MPVRCTGTNSITIIYVLNVRNNPFSAIIVVDQVFKFRYGIETILFHTLTTVFIIVLILPHVVLAMLKRNCVGSTYRPYKIFIIFKSSFEYNTLT
jgi:hypothetical protein